VLKYPIQLKGPLDVSLFATIPNLFRALGGNARRVARTPARRGP
jgi:hypothetical protein